MPPTPQRGEFPREVVNAVARRIGNGMWLRALNSPDAPSIHGLARWALHAAAEASKDGTCPCCGREGSDA